MGGPDPVEVLLLGVGVFFLGAFWLGAAVTVILALRLVGAAIAEWWS